eukprot:scaffold1054_cov116-Isochrysis_galbana.AAC.3
MKIPRELLHHVISGSAAAPRAPSWWTRGPPRLTPAPANGAACRSAPPTVSGTPVAASLVKSSSSSTSMPAPSADMATPGRPAPSSGGRPTSSKLKYAGKETRKYRP